MNSKDNYVTGGGGHLEPYTTSESITTAQRLKLELDSYRPFSREVIENLRAYLLVEWTFNSNAIEGNTLTRTETKVVLEDGITIGGKTVREHFEAINHKEAILLLEELVRREEELSERVIKNLHGLILRGIDSQNAGVYRRQNVLISGADHIPPDHVVVPERMERLLQWYQDEGSTLHPLVRASILHSDFLKIHPFIDGNGRTARLLMNLDLMQSGYPPVIIPNDQRVPYYDALDRSHVTGDYHDMVELVSRLAVDSLRFYLKFVK